MDFLKRAVDPLGITSSDMGTVFITSGTGVLGHRVAINLLDAGYSHVRVGVWKGKRQIGGDDSIGQKVADELEAKGATVLAFDWTDESQYEMALAGVRTVFCTLPHMKAFSNTFEKFEAACRKAKVDHFVLTSFYKVGQDSDPFHRSTPKVQFHRQCDEILKKPRVDSVMTYTLLRTSHLMSGPLVLQGPILREEHKYITASYAMGVNYVSPNDVVKCAVECLVNRKKHRNKTYNLTAAQPILDKSVAKYLSKFYDTEIEHVAVGFHEYVEELKKREYPEWLIEDLSNFERIKASGVEEKTVAYSNDIQELTKLNPETFKDYLSNKETMTLQENPSDE